MKMSRKLPIRTYERKKALVPVVNLYRSQISLATENYATGHGSVERTKLVGSRQSPETNMFLGDDPFETTFDRLVKDTVLPPPLPVQSDASWLGSSFESSIKEQKSPLLCLSTSLCDDGAAGRVKQKKNRKLQVTARTPAKHKRTTSGRKKTLPAKRKKVQQLKPSTTDELEENRLSTKCNNRGESTCDSEDYFYGFSKPMCGNSILTDSSENNSLKLYQKKPVITVNSHSKSRKDQIKNNAKKKRKKQKKKAASKKGSSADLVEISTNSFHFVTTSKKDIKKIHRKKQQSQCTVNKSIKDMSVIINAWPNISMESMQNSFSLQVDANKETSKKRTIDSSMNKEPLGSVDVCNLTESSNNIEIKPCSVKLMRHIIKKQKLECSYSFNMDNDLRGFAANGEAFFKLASPLLSRKEKSTLITRGTTDCFVHLDRIKPFMPAKNPEKAEQSLICSTPMNRPKRLTNHVITVSPIVRIERLHAEQFSAKDNGALTNLGNGSVKVDLYKVSSDITPTVNEIESLKEESANRISNICSYQKSEKISVDSESFINNLQLQPTELLTSYESYTNLTENCSEAQEDARQGKSNTSSIQKLQPQYIIQNISEGSDRTCSLFDDSNSICNALDKDNLTTKINDTYSSSITSTSYMLARIENSGSLEHLPMSKESVLEDINSLKSQKLNFDLEECKASLVLQHTESMCHNTNTSVKEDSNLNGAREEINVDVKNEIDSTVDNKQEDRCSKFGLGKACSEKEQKYIDDNNTNRLSARLQDPFRITDRRKRNKKWNLQLPDICENQDDALASSDTAESQPKRLKSANDVINTYFCSSPNDKFLSSERSFLNPSLNQSQQTSVFLKPGKSWARSLSILNNIQNGCNLNDLAVGKGKKWRHSVRDILNMQEQGIIQSCVKNVGDVKHRRTCNDSIKHKSECILKDERHSAFGFTNTNRFSRRVSVRVVVDNKNVDCIEDTPFREAYGITGNQSRISVLPKSRNSFQDGIHCSHENSIAETHSGTTAKEVVLQRCDQEDYLAFAECYPDSYLEHCRKIGEGVYGEVFLYEHEQQRSVIKIIPIEGNALVNGEPQKKFDEILSEIVISKELHNLRFTETYNTNGFVEVLNMRCIIGMYPEKLIELWKVYDEEKTSDNDCPSMFDHNQLYIALELGHGGQDLEAFVFQTAVESHAIFVQTALALAVAEKCLEFEHRDLHWGNILISRTDESCVCYKLDNKDIELPSKGVKVSIIDFTLSRMSYEGCCIFNDLALDPALFTAQGEYQFEIYRLMRDKTENNWQNFEPHTNVLWLHYTLDKMITAARYKKKNLKMHKKAIADLTELRDVVLTYESAFDFVTHCNKLADLCNNFTPGNTAVRALRKR